MTSFILNDYLQVEWRTGHTIEFEQIQQLADPESITGWVMSAGQLLKSFYIREGRLIGLDGENLGFIDIHKTIVLTDAIQYPSGIYLRVDYELQDLEDELPRLEEPELDWSVEGF